MKHKKRIFSGDASVPMWNDINKARTADDLRWALYHVCCRLQEFESQVRASVKAVERKQHPPKAGHV